jgi:hypothetical protein
MTINAQSEVAPLLSLLLKHPPQAWISQENVRDKWRVLGFADGPDFARTVDEYDGFVETLRRSVPEIRFLPERI